MAKTPYFEIDQTTKKPGHVYLLEAGEEIPENTTVLDPANSGYIDPKWNGRQWVGTKTREQYNAEIAEKNKKRQDEDEAWKADMTQQVMLLQMQLNAKGGK